MTIANFVAFLLQKDNLFFLMFLWGIVGNMLHSLFLADEYEESLVKGLHFLAGIWKRNKPLSITLTLICALMVSSAMQYHVFFMVYGFIAAINIMFTVYKIVVALIISASLKINC